MMSLAARFISASSLICYETKRAFLCSTWGHDGFMPGPIRTGLYRHVNGKNLEAGMWCKTKSDFLFIFFQPSVCPSITPADTHSNSHTDSPLHHCSGPRTKPLSGQTNILLLSVQPFLGRWWTVNRARLNSLIKAGHKRPSEWRQLVLCSAFSSYQPREVRSKKMKPSRRDRVTVEWKAESEKHKGAGAKL